MKNIIAAGLITSALMMGGAFAQSAPRVTPQAVIVNPVQTELQTRVWLDRQGDNPVYNIGEKIRINVSVNQDAYVYLFSIHSDGVVDLILPNKLSGGGEFLRANETRSLPIERRWSRRSRQDFGRRQQAPTEPERNRQLQR
jgi:hypothetical protein